MSDVLTSDELVILPRLRLDLDRFDAFRADDVRVLLDIIDRLDAALRASRPTVTAGYEALRPLSEAATPGPWLRQTEGNASVEQLGHKLLHDLLVPLPDGIPPHTDATYLLTEDGSKAVAFIGNGPRQTENGDFIVAAVNHVRTALAASPETTPAGVLDEAWAAAEEALPEGGKTTLMVSTLPTAFGGSVKAEAYAHPANRNYERMAVGSGPTPAAALHALAAALGRSGNGGGRG